MSCRSIFLLFFLAGGAAAEQSRLDVAVEALRAGRFEEARARLETIVAALPSHARAAAFLATAEIRTGDVERGIARAERLLAADAGVLAADLHELLGQAEMEQRRWIRAEHHWRALIEERPGSEEAHYRLACTLAQQGRGQDALEAAKRAIGINPRRSDAMALRGNLLAADGRAAEAESEWRRALAIDDNNAEALAGLAVHLRAREPEQALEYARRAVEATRWRSSAAIRVLALVHRSRGEVDKASEVIRKGVEALSDDPALAAELRALQRR